MAREDIVRQKRFAEAERRLTAQVTRSSHPPASATSALPLRREVRTMKAKSVGCMPAVPGFDSSPVMPSSFSANQSRRCVYLEKKEVTERELASQSWLTRLERIFFRITV